MFSEQNMIYCFLSITIVYFFQKLKTLVEKISLCEPLELFSRRRWRLQ